MKKILILTMISILAFALTGCGLIEKIFPPEAVPETVDEKLGEEEKESMREPGTLPEELGYPTVGTTAQAGDTVLVPLIEELETAFEFGIHRGFFTFFKGKMLEPGDFESLIEDYFGDKKTIPNSLIIPIKPNQSVEPGDVVLTVWQSNDPANPKNPGDFDVIGDFTMIRAIVVGDEEIGQSQTPTIRYLTNFIDVEEKLEANTFHKLTGELEPGISVIVKNEKGKSEYATIINIAGEKVLLAKELGRLAVANKDDLTILPPTLDLEVGDTIIVPLISDNEEVTVSQIEPEIGQVWGEFQWAGSPQTDIFYFGEFTK